MTSAIDLNMAGIKKLKWGKKIGNCKYFYMPDLKVLDLLKVTARWNLHAFNVIKINMSTHEVSLMEYMTFMRSDHPVLLGSRGLINIGPDYCELKKLIVYNNNRPIIHRKELMLNPDAHELSGMIALTRAEEELGLYENTRIIGRQNTWALLVEKALKKQRDQIKPTEGN